MFASFSARYVLIFPLEEKLLPTRGATLLSKSADNTNSLHLWRWNGKLGEEIVE